MKILTLVIDSVGHLHVAACSSPDLLRRTISAETGSVAHLVWCCVPESGTGSGAVVAEFERRLQGSRIRPGVYRLDRRIAVSVLEAIAVAEPRLRQRRLHRRRQLRRLLHMARHLLTGHRRALATLADPNVHPKVLSQIRERKSAEKPGSPGVRTSGSIPSTSPAR
jgi:hypothetical protein